KTGTTTNTRKPRPTLIPYTALVRDAGKFNLQIDGQTSKADAACGTGTGAVQVGAGAHTVGETGGTGTSLSNYTSVIGGDCAADGRVSLAAGQNKTCTVDYTPQPTMN